MNRKAKGRRAEKEYAEILKDRGYIVELVKPSNKFGGVDFFGVADIIALHATGTYLIQVKSNTPRNARKLLTEWYNKNMVYLPNNIHLDVAVRYDNKDEGERWRIITVI